MSNSNDDVKGGEARLWSLIEQRTHPMADTAAIDARIWDLFGDTMAVMFTDLTGFSRQVVSFGIIHFLQEIFEQKRLLIPIVADHDGLLLKIEADSFLIVFRRIEKALACAVAMQRACQNLNQRRIPEEQVLLCVGLGYGKVLRIGDVDVYGAEVNAASKLGEDIAKANEILITAEAKTALGEASGFEFSDAEIVVPGSDKNFRVHYQSQ